jgi:3-hydroxy-9,10-secoandrosta-1,3,5(10)-triene-9,17-dione monooxygenase
MSRAEQAEPGMETADAADGTDGRRALPQPEPGLTAEELIRRAIALRPMIREEQDASERRGYYSEELHREFLKAGFYRIVQPRLFGGYEFDLTTFYRVMVEVSRGDPGTGWCLTLGASHAWVIASHWSERAQREIFGPDGDFRSPHRAPAAGCECRKVNGGYIANGTWDYCSGIPYATHFMGMAPGRGQDGGFRMVTFVVPRSQVTMLDDWGGENTLGMRASGSHSVRVSEVFVPEHMVVEAEPPLLWGGHAGGKPTPGTLLHGNPMYLGRVSGPYHASLVSPVVGAARAALDEYEEIITTKMTMFPPIVPRSHHYDVQRPFGQALGMTDSAETLLIAAVDQYMEFCRRWERDGTPISLEDSLRLWGMIQNAGRLACEAVEFVVPYRQFRRGTQRAALAALFPGRRDVSRAYLVAVPQHGFEYRAGPFRPAWNRPVRPIGAHSMREGRLTDRGCAPARESLQK